jgi:DNA-binding transcriptional LysR family regulator
MLHEADVDVRFYGDDWPPEPNGKGLCSVELGRPAMMAVAAPGLASTLNNLHSVAELVSAPLLHECDEHPWRAWFRGHSVNPAGPLAGQVFWQAPLAIDAARRGRGVLLSSPYLIQKDLDACELVELEIPGIKRVVIGGYYFLARENRWSQPTVVEVRRFLQRCAHNTECREAA